MSESVEDARFAHAYTKLMKRNEEGSRTIRQEDLLRIDRIPKHDLKDNL